MIDGFNKLIVSDADRRDIADLQNAYEITEEQRINSISHLSFTLPYNDPKNIYCTAFNYVRIPDGQLYRIMQNGKTLTEMGEWRYRCEHVFVSLIDNLMIGDVVMGGIGRNTAAVIRQILDRQRVRHWVLGDCDFDFQFEYGWTDESLLSAVLDVPHHFTEPFMWEFETHVYPFRLHLRRLNPNAIPQVYIETGKNMIKTTRRTDETSVCTRLYPFGYGEGVNRLDISGVNNGINYLQSPPDVMARYGIIEKTFVDRRIQNAQSLKEIGASILKEAQEPFEEYEVDMALRGEDPFSIPRIGSMCEIVDFKTTFITGITWNYDEVPSVTLTLANRTRDIASEVLQLRNRQRIESTYAQGVSQFWQLHNFMNAMPNAPAELPVFLPGSMRIVNFVTLDVEVRPFRMNVRQTEEAAPWSGTWTSSQPSNETTQTAGAQTVTPSGTIGQAGAQNITPTGSIGTAGAQNITPIGSIGQAGAQTLIIPGYGREEATAVHGFTGGSAHNHGVPHGAALRSGLNLGTAFAATPGGGSVTVATITSMGIVHNFAESGAHTHPQREASIQNHIHLLTMQPINIQGHIHTLTMNQINISNHAHTLTMNQISISGHVHNMPHTHTTTIPNHRHILEPAITSIGNPTSFTIRINGQNRQTITGRNITRQIQEWLTDQSGIVQLNRLHNIEIVPNAPAFVRIVVYIQGFLMAERDLII